MPSLICPQCGEHEAVEVAIVAGPDMEVGAGPEIDVVQVNCACGTLGVEGADRVYDEIDRLWNEDPAVFDPVAEEW